MANDSTIAGFKSVLDTLQTTAQTNQTKTKSTKSTDSSSETSSSSSSSTSSTAEMGQQEFLTLLCEQLENQDPLDPMDSDEFAVQLAQFSSLEQLISINEKLNEGDTSSISSMASYLGNEVVLNDAEFSVTDGTGSNLLVDVPSGTQSLRVDITDSSGNVVAQKTFEDIESGRQLLSLTNMEVDDGTYSVRVVSVDESGSFVDLDAQPTQTVEGFVVSPEAKLIVGGEEVSPEDVLEVYQGKSS